MAPTSRKRQRNPSSWKSSIRKVKVAKGLEHQSSHSSRVIAAKRIKPPCSDCPLNCNSNFGASERAEIFHFYYNTLRTINEKRTFVISCVKEIQNPRRSEEAITKRRSYSFFKNGNPIKVCCQFFKSTLDVSLQTVKTALLKKYTVGPINVSPCRRGFHQNKKTVGSGLKDAARRFIDGIPRVESHYLRQQTSRQ